MKQLLSIKTLLLLFILLAQGVITRAQSVNLIQNSSGIVEYGNTALCNDGTNNKATSYYRSFKISDYITTGTLKVDTVYFVIDQCYSPSGQQPIAIKLYSSTSAVPTLSNMTLLTTINGNIPNVTLGGSLLYTLTDVGVPGTGYLVIEIAIPTATNGSLMYVASNQYSQSGPSYFLAPICGTSVITDMNNAGLPNYTSLLISATGRGIDTPGDFTNSVSPVCRGANGVVYSVPNVPGVTYNWSYSGTGVTINSAGNTATLNFADNATAGTLSVKAALGSATSPARTFPIAMGAGPNPAISRAGNVLTVLGGPYTSYQWYRNTLPITGATTNSYTLTQNGSYYIKVTDATTTCSIGVSSIAAIDDVVGIHDIDLQNKIKIYPNPVKDIVTIESPVLVNATLAGIDGKIVMYLNNVSKVSLKALSAGMYVITLTDREGNMVKKEKIIKSN